MHCISYFRFLISVDQSMHLCVSHFALKKTRRPIGIGLACVKGPSWVRQMLLRLFQRAPATHTVDSPSTQNLFRDKDIFHDDCDGTIVIPARSLHQNLF